MQVRLETQGFELTNALDTAAREQVFAALARLSESVVCVEVFMKDINGPKGGHDKQVLLRIALRGRGAIAVESRRGDWHAALAVAARRARRSVRRFVKKSQRLEKGRLRELRNRPAMEPGFDSI